MNSIIEPVAKRLFDGYSRYCRQSGLEELQYVTEEAYKLHERLRKQPGNKNGLHHVDEFLLLKTLRNYSVHQGEFVGEVFAIKLALAKELDLDLPKVCLIQKGVVKKAINYEPRLANDAKEQKKVKSIRGQLVDFGEYYNLEPVIYNFIVKVYELLISLKLSIPGEGFKELHTAYKKEEYYRFDHYVPLSPVDVDHALLLDNLIPLEKTLEKVEELAAPELDPWYSVGALDIDFSTFELMTYSESDYEFFSNAMLGIFVRDDDSYKVAMAVPNHIGVALITESGQLTGFNVNKQLEQLKKAGIEIDEAYLDLAPDELLVLSLVDNTQLFPVVLSKQDLIAAYQALISNASSEIKSSVDKSALAKEKLKKKSKRKQASKARKSQRKKK
ncbi:MAG: hypothetical protein JKY50_18600 [Oleispira sp.]|nr:hypothetical protein [Oleispira sp.]